MYKKILVIVDMQNDFVSGCLGNEETKAVLPKIVKKIRDHGKDYDVICATKDIHYAESYMDSLEGKKLPIPHCIDGTDGAAICAELKDALDELMPSRPVIRFEKNTFGSKHLMAYLRNVCGRDTIIELCGVCTDICVVSNAICLRAELPNNIICVDASCCAGTSPSAHESALSTMASCQIDILEVNEHGKA